MITRRVVTTMTTDNLHADGRQMSDRARRYLQAHAAAPERAAPVDPVMPLRQRGYGGLYRNAPARGFAEAIAVCMSKYFTFSGRASRSEFWYFALFQFLVGIAMVIVDVRYFGADLTRDESGPASSVASLLLFFPFLAVSWRRLHDIGRSGWWIGGFWLASIGVVVMLVATMSSGTGVVQAAGMAVALGVGALIYSILLLVFMCTRGDPGPNRFG
jgi:uncharacterized membrane protein YhaH (DUF805 family)